MTKSQMLAKLNEKLESIRFKNIDDEQAANKFWELAQVIKYVEKGY